MDLSISAGQAGAVIGFAAVIFGVVYVATSAWPYADRTRFGPGMAILSSLLIVAPYAVVVAHRSIMEGILLAVIVGAVSMGLYDVAKAVVWHDDEHGA